MQATGCSLKRFHQQVRTMEDTSRVYSKPTTVMSSQYRHVLQCPLAVHDSHVMTRAETCFSTNKKNLQLGTSKVHRAQYPTVSTVTFFCTGVKPGLAH